MLYKLLLGCNFVEIIATVNFYLIIVHYFLKCSQVFNAGRLSRVGILMLVFEFVTIYAVKIIIR